MNNQNGLSCTTVKRWFIQPGLLALFVFSIALLLPTSHFAAEPAVEEYIEIARADYDKLEFFQSAGYMKLILLDGVALTDIISGDANASQLPELTSGFSIECSARFDSTCKLFPIDQN